MHHGQLRQLSLVSAKSRPSGSTSSLSRIRYFRSSQPKCPQPVATPRTIDLSHPLHSPSSKADSFLHQGPLTELDHHPSGNSDQDVTYPTVIEQARANLRKFPHCVVLTRVGSFYEIYFEQALKYGPLLNLKVARKRTSVGQVYMAGFPFYRLDKYVQTLVQDMNKFVAISEEFANCPIKRSQPGGLQFDRKVTRVITPGTLIDEKFSDPCGNNFLLAISFDSQTRTLPRSAPDWKRVSNSSSNGHSDDPQVGISWLDLSSGDFYTQVVKLSSVTTSIPRINPREVIVDCSAPDRIRSDLGLLAEQERYSLTYREVPDASQPMHEWPVFSTISDRISPADTHRFTDLERMASYFLIDYVTEQLLGTVPKLQLPNQKSACDVMILDKSTIRALEIRSTLLENRFEGSLLHWARRTVTKSGARLLTHRLLAPSTDMTEIHRRLEIVQLLVDCPVLRGTLVSLLSGVEDSPRLIQRLSLGRGDSDDLLSIAKTIERMNDIKSVLEHHDQFSNKTGNTRKFDPAGAEHVGLEDIWQRIDVKDLLSLARKILESIDEERLNEQTQSHDRALEAEAELGNRQPEKVGRSKSRYKSKTNPVSGTLYRKERGDGATEVDVWTMKRDASPALVRLHNQLARMLETKAEMETKLREDLKSPSLSLKWSPGLGHICHVRSRYNNPNGLKTLRGTHAASSTRSTRSFHLPEWTKLGLQLEGICQEIRAEERAITERLRMEVARHSVEIRNSGYVLEELDVSCSFASIAVEQNFVKPILTEGTEHLIFQGRHPTVERGLNNQGLQFIPNDCVLLDQHPPPEQAEAQMGGTPPTKITETRGLEAELGQGEAGGIPRVRLQVITGPNMGGKSTYLRQNAVISILAQAGSFVPATYTQLGMVDRLFTRIGSADNLYLGQSTFKLEMMEMAVILRECTDRSFVIMDEVGRGTSPDHGVAISFAALHHLAVLKRPRALIATHFLRLPKIIQADSDLNSLVGFQHSSLVKNPDGSWYFDYALTPGFSEDSHALETALMAGVPENVLETAREFLERNHS